MKKKESSWAECIEASSSLKVSPDRAKSASLIDTAKGRVEFIKKIKVEKDNANYVFEGYYSSVLEILHALVLLEGYKVENHICLGYYLRDILNKQDLFRLFDDCRYKRVSLLYYGKRMDFETAKEAIEKCRKLMEKLEEYLAVAHKPAYRKTP